MRITGGMARGIRLRCPVHGRTRPATDQMREAVFSSLGAEIEAAVVWDFFAGTGAYGLEALSRGAKLAVFVERDRQALSCLKENLASVLRSMASQGAGGEVPTGRVFARDVLKMDVEHVGADGRPDFIFLDPPYAETDKLLEALAATSLNSPLFKSTTLIIEGSGEAEPLVPGWSMVRRIGKARRDSPGLYLYRKDAERAAQETSETL